MPDPNAVGQDRTYKDITEAHDADKGTYSDNIEAVPTDSRLPTSQLPQAPDPSPFVVGPAAPGGRGPAAAE
ncbi:MAG: hypothetical protein V3W28_01520 [Thermoplasmata archaeon]